VERAKRRTGECGEFPFNNNGVPVVAPELGFQTMVLVGLVTSGNRSGDFAISANALDALLVPGIGQVAGAAPESLDWPAFSPTRNSKS